LCAAMVRFAVQSEYAHTVEDVLARRWRALFLDAAQAREMAPAVAALLREEGVADPQLDAFLGLSLRYAAPGV
jgi:glycerol-3-phosphate dehydrogenase